MIINIHIVPMGACGTYIPCIIVHRDLGGLFDTEEAYSAGKTAIIAHYVKFVCAMLSFSAVL